MNYKKYLNETFKLVDKADIDEYEIWGIGDHYIATTKHDVYNAPNRLTIGDSVGAFLKNKEGTKAEITIYFLDEDEFEVHFEDTTNPDIEDEELVYKTEGFSERQLYDFLNILFLDFDVIYPRTMRESFEGFDFEETITEEPQKDTEKEVKRIIQSCCKGKAREVLPKKWAIDRDTVVLVFWHNYFENKKVMNLCNKIEDMLQDELGMEMSVCADSTAHLNWHNI